MVEPINNILTTKDINTYPMALPAMRKLRVFGRWHGSKQHAIGKALFFIIMLHIITVSSFSQGQTYRFSPGFNAGECDDMLQLNFAFLDTIQGNRFDDFLRGYTFIYRSPNIGLDNAWDLWIRSDSTVVITLRGTTADPKSILADFYCAMVPANGQLYLTKNDTVNYQLAADERAAVHAGFLIGFGFLSKDIAPRLDSLYRQGFHNYLITGHSQGGSLAYYISAWLIYLKKNGAYPLLNVKTYASAPTKVGNMYFAYDYDNITRSEWTFSIVNSADPVPEMPFTTQQVDSDINEPNPIISLMKRFDDLPLLKRIVLKRAFNRMRKNASKSSNSYQKYLGGYSAKFINGMLPELTVPQTVNTTYFVRPGVPVSLVVNDAYLEYFAVNEGPYYHHGVTPYRFLLRQYYEGLDELK